MTLNGKAKVDFEKWYYSEDSKRYANSVETFYKFTNPLKYGVYVDWFDSVGVEIYYHCDETVLFDVDGDMIEDRIHTTSKLPRPKARTAAITKATELYNNRK